MHTEWALQQLADFLALTAFEQRARQSDGTRYRARVGSSTDILSASAVVEQVLDRATPDWRTVEGPRSRNDRWDPIVEAVHRAHALLVRQAELDEKLGDNAPRLDASSLHPWIWDGARSLWSTGHYREAVGIGAAVRLNAETQNKVGRTDVSETDLFNQVFSTDPPQLGKPRLRLRPNDGSATFTSVHRGARSFAEGCYAAIRNPISHTLGELPEAEALEQLAAFSVLARWVDGATVERAS